jgi:uncharacterized membrane protein YkoI
MRARPLHDRLLVLVLAAGLLPAQSGADESWHGDRGRRGHHHDDARAALQQGAILPIAEILGRVAAEVPGELIEVELEQEDHEGHAGWIYELKLITPDGRRLEIIVDAATGRLLGQEED